MTEPAVDFLDLDGRPAPEPRLRALSGTLNRIDTRVSAGRLLAVTGVIVKADLPTAEVGELCEFRDPQSGRAGKGEVIGLDGPIAFIAPFGHMYGLSQRTQVIGTGRFATVEVGDHLLGCVLDGLGDIMQRPPGKPPHTGRTWQMPIHADPPDCLRRQPITKPLPLGIRAIDGLITCAEGQRMGVFGSAGAGKSTLTSEIVGASAADVIIIALIGERGREVLDVIHKTLGEENRKRAILVVSTSDRPSVERMKAALVAQTVAEYFRDTGRKVLLIVDSVTRYARALRELGLAMGEPPARRGFPPSVFANLPKLFERAGPGEKGSITALYATLAECDLALDPVVEETKSLLDGHIILSDKLAAAGHYPAIDVLESKSRIMEHVVASPHKKAANRVRELMARYREIELLVRVGEYQKGNDPVADLALERKPLIDRFLQQGLGQRTSFEKVVQELIELAR